MDHEFCSYAPLTANGEGVDLMSLSQSNTESSNEITKVFLLSYYRSGNHLTLAMIRCLLQHDTISYRNEYPEMTDSEYHEMEQAAVESASTDNIYVRKVHSTNSIPLVIQNYVGDSDIGLIYLIRDPVEAMLSHIGWVPFYWKDFEQELGRFWPNAAFYEQWKSDASKLVLYYEDYHNAGDPYINLRKLREYFGKDRVSEDQLNQCIGDYKKLQNIGLESLERKQTTSLSDLHFYRNRFYGENAENWPTIKVESQIYHIFGKYDNIERCSPDDE